MKIKITIVCFFSFFYFNFANAKLVSIATDNSKEFLLVSNVVQLLFEQLSFNVSIQQGDPNTFFFKTLEGEFNIFITRNTNEIKVLQNENPLMIKFSTLYFADDEKNDMVILLNSNNIEDIDKGSLKVLRRLEFTKNGINSLEKYNSQELMSPRDAARTWLGTHPNTVEYLFDTSED